MDIHYQELHCCC